MLIGVDGSRVFNHGCEDYAVVEMTKTTGVVIESQSCHSCWQVGHDTDHIFYEVGDVVEIDMSQLEATRFAGCAGEVGRSAVERRV